MTKTNYTQAPPWH